MVLILALEGKHPWLYVTVVVTCTLTVFHFKSKNNGFTRVTAWQGNTAGKHTMRLLVRRTKEALQSGRCLGAVS